MDEKIYAAKNHLADLDTREITLCASQSVPGGEFLIKKSKNIPENSEVVMKSIVIKAMDKVNKQVFGYCLVADVPDSQGDLMSVEDVKKAAHKFLENLSVHKNQAGTASGIEHSEFDNINYPIESCLDIDGSVGRMHGVPEDQVQKNAWWIGIQCDETTWGKVEKGELNGFSVGGWGKRTPIGKESKITKVVNAVRTTIKKDSLSFSEAFVSRNAWEDVEEMSDALMSSIYSILYDEELEDKKSAINESIREYCEALIAYFSVLKTAQDNTFIKKSEIVADLSKCKSIVDVMEILKKYEIENQTNDSERNNDMTEEQIKKMQEGIIAAVSKGIDEKIITAVDSALEKHEVFKGLVIKVAEMEKTDKEKADAAKEAEIAKANELPTLRDDLFTLCERIEKIEKTTPGPSTLNNEPPTEPVKKSDEEEVSDEIKKSNDKFEGTHLSFS